MNNFPYDEDDNQDILDQREIDESLLIQNMDFNNEADRINAVKNKYFTQQAMGEASPESESMVGQTMGKSLNREPAMVDTSTKNDRDPFQPPQIYEDAMREAEQSKVDEVVVSPEEKLLSTYKQLSSPPKDELSELQKNTRDSNKNLNLQRGLNQVLQGMAYGYGAKIGDGSEAIDAMVSENEKTLNDYNQRREDLVKRENSDPNSPISKMQMSIINNMAKQAGVPIEQFGPISAANSDQVMRSLAYILQNKTGQEERRLSREQNKDLTLLKLKEISENKDTKRSEKQEKLVNDRVKALGDNVTKQGLIEKNNAMGNINDYLETNYGKDLSTIEDASIPGVGFMGKYRPDFTMDSKDVNFRQNVASLANSLLKSRSGAAVTDQEYKRFLEEVGSGNFSNEKNLLTGLKKMQQDIQGQNRNVGKIYGDEISNEYESRTGDKLNYGTPKNQNNSNMVKMQLPNGQVKLIPKENVQKAIQRGAKEVN